MYNKKFLCIIALALILACTAGISLASQPVSILVNGKEIVSDIPTQIIDGRTMVPVRFVSEALGAKVDWNEKTATVSIMTAPAEESKLLRVNGELTTWPYWYEEGILYLEYHNTMELLHIAYPHPNYTTHYFKETGTLQMGSRSVELEPKQKGEYIVLPLNAIQKHDFIKYEWDSKTGNLTISTR